MADLRKQEYYRQNREARLRYQKERYERIRDQIMRQRELERELEPEEWEAKRRKRQKYNREYYQKNRDRIRKQRAEKRKRKQDTGLEEGRNAS